MKKISKAVQSSLNAIEVCKRRILAFHYAIQDRPRDDKSFDAAVNAIYCRLYDKLNDAYATLFMWGNVAPAEAQKEARKHAFEHYLKQQQSIMHYVDLELKHPDQWFSEEEEEFREEIEKAKESGGTK